MPTCIFVGTVSVGGKIIVRETTIPQYWRLADKLQGGTVVRASPAMGGSARAVRVVTFLPHSTSPRNPIRPNKDHQPTMNAYI